MHAPAIIAIGEAPLTLRDVEAIAHGRLKLELSASGREAIVRAREVVERLVDDGIPAYGITTGVGSQKDFGISRAAIARYNDLMITAHATATPGRNAPAAV